MGLFSTKKTINVSSTVYNMAGDEADRPNFMKSTIFGAVMNPNKGGFLGDTLVQSYLNGPGINQRMLFNHAVRTNYFGLPTYSISQTIIVDPEVVRPFITIPGSPAGQEAVIQNCTLSDGDYEVFAEKYMNENYPAEFNTNWVAEYNQGTHTITIQRDGGGTVTFGAGDYDSKARFVVANYYLAIPENPQSLDLGTLVSGVTSGLPSTAGYTLDSTTNTGNVLYVQDQTRVITKVYSNGDPTVVDTDYPHIETNFDTILTVHYKDVYNENDGTTPQRSKTRTFRNVWEYRNVYTSSSTNVVVNDLGGGVTETVTTDITGDFLQTMYDYRLDTQDTVLTSIVGGNLVFIYKLGTGNATLDALNVAIGSDVTAEFFPVIPIRIDNVSIRDSSYAALYEPAKKLYSRATRRQKLDKLIDEVEDNPDLGEIDFAYIQWAVTLNTQEKEALKYIYTFWKNLMPLHGLPSNYITTYNSQLADYQNDLDDYNDWLADQANDASGQFGTAQPDYPPPPQPQITTLQFKTDDPAYQSYDNRISFVFIDETTFTGVGQIGAVKGDLWMTNGTPITWGTETGVNAPGTIASTLAQKITKSNGMDLLNIFWQTGTNQYKRLRIYGGVHENFIYGGKAVRITTSEAIADADDSGFLIPLHYPSLKDAGLVSSTQMATANTYIVFNSYEVVKKKWYETFLGMLFIIIVIAVAAALIAPNFVGGISGAFGTNASVGASFGLTGTGAIVAGAVTNAIAGVLISTALSYGATALFGEKWGALIASIVGFAISFGMGGGFSNLSTLFQPSNILALSSALANGYAGFVKGSIAEMNEELAKIGEEYKKESDKIKDMMAEFQNDLSFNPMSLTDAAKGNGSRTGSYLPESLDDFIQRTTLTGSDIVDMTLSIINNFSDLSLTLPKT